MRFKIIISIFFLASTTVSFAQGERSKGDVLFFEYAYREAIQQYQKEMLERPLTNQQQLNLADSFLKIGNYKNASENYLEVYKKDSTMSNHHFNKMLQSMSKTSGVDRVKAFLGTKTSGLSNELLENAEFNFELLKSEDSKDLDYKIFNLNSNSPQSDFSPAFYGDKLLFSSGRPQDSKNTYNPSGEGYLDIFVGKMGLGGQVLNPNPFTSLPKSKFHEATPYYSQDLNKIFYIRSNEDKGRMSFDENGKNALALGLAEGDGTFRYLLRDLSTSFYYPFYNSGDGKLYFAANFEDSYGGTDIYFVYTNNGLIMSAPENLGPRINTPGNEIAPFIFESSLYFSSDVFYGLGGMDIYKSEMLEDGVFSIPTNLGKGINSKEDDFGFIIKNHINEGLLGYFSSNREGGKGGDDIYGFLVKEKPGIKTLAFRGTIMDANSTSGIPKVSVKLFDKDDNLLKEATTNSSGEYRLEVPWLDSAKLEASMERYSIFRESYDKTALDSITVTAKDIPLVLLDDLVQEKEDQTVIKMNKFFFEKGKANITPEIAAELDKAVDAVKMFPKLQLRIEAHTDSRGGSAANFRLSQQRADAIKEYFLEKGMPDSNILYTVGYGEEKITNNCTNGKYCLEILHKQNERHLIVVLNYNLLYE